jgi:hypothetical protein
MDIPNPGGYQVKESEMTRAALLDTSIDSNNDGDQIIVQSILERFPELHNVPRLPTHRYLTNSEAAIAREQDVLIVTGTNILTSRLWRDRQWKYKLRHLPTMDRKVVFLGVGWRQYQGKLLRRTRWTLDRMILQDLPIAARDQYTATKLIGEGYDAVNTGCPTMWRLPTQLVQLGQRDECVFTYTDYNPDPQRDEAVLEKLASLYACVHIWPQSEKDWRNLQSAKLPANVYRLDRGVRALDKAIVNRDYVGTRLHAGIRAAQAGSAAMVIAVDNRALEIARDTGFPAVDRKLGLAEFVNRYKLATERPAVLTMPKQQIADWTKQFRSKLCVQQPGEPAGPDRLEAARRDQ